MIKKCHSNSRKQGVSDDSGGARFETTTILSHYVCIVVYVSGLGLPVGTLAVILVYHKTRHLYIQRVIVLSLEIDRKL